MQKDTDQELLNVLREQVDEIREERKKRIQELEKRRVLFETTGTESKNASEILRYLEALPKSDQLRLIKFFDKVLNK